MPSLYPYEVRKIVQGAGAASGFAGFLFPSLRARGLGEEKPVPPYSAIIYKEDDEVRAEDWKGRKIASGEAGVDDASVIRSALSVGGLIVIAKGDYTINEELEVTQRRTIIAYEASFRVHKPLKIYCKSGEYWRRIVTPAPRWFGGEFYIYEGGRIEIGDGINIKFVDFTIQPKADSLDLLKLTTYQNWIAMCELSGSITDTDRETDTAHDNLNLIKIEKGTGDSTVGARAKLDLRLGATEGNNNICFHVAPSTSLYDADVRLVLFINGAKNNKGLFLDGYVGGTSFILRGEGYSNAIIIDIGNNFAGALKYNLDGLTGSYKILNNPYGKAVGGMAASQKFWGSLNIGLNDSYGSAAVLNIINGFIPRIGFRVEGAFASGEVVTIKIEVKYTDESSIFIEKSYSSPTSDYDWLTDDDYYNLHKRWSVPEKINLYAKTNQATTNINVKYKIYGGGFVF